MFDHPPRLVYCVYAFESLSERAREVADPAAGVQRNVRLCRQRLEDVKCLCRVGRSSVVAIGH
jgi:hypothetical protein